MPVEKTSPAFQFYPKDFLSSSKVQGMSMTERGVYMTLLSHCWLDGALPANFDALARLVGMKAAQFERIWKKSPLHACFLLTDDGYVNRRLDVERRKQAEYRRRQSDNGKLGGRPKAVGSPGLPDGEAKESSSSSSPISDLPVGKEHQQGETGPRRMAPIHDRAHRNHAHCGRVCLHASLFGEFVRRRNHDGADLEIRDWAMTVEREWGPDGPRAQDEPGDAFEFWKARYAEQWPAVRQASARMPAWAV